MSPLRVVVVEDEPVSRAALRLRLQREADVEIVGEAENGVEAIRVIESLQPDVVFLDIEIPPPDGFGVLQRVAPVHLPAVVFVTAYDTFALRAFDVQALDFLLKPIDQERVRRALARARAAVHHDADAAHRRLGEFLSRRERESGGERCPDRLVVRQGHRYHLVATDTLEWLEAKGNYVRLHAGRSTYLVRSTLRDMAEMLDSTKFVQIHRGIVVSVERVASINATTHGDYDVVLHSGAHLRMSRKFRENLLPQ